MRFQQGECSAELTQGRRVPKADSGKLRADDGDAFLRSWLRDRENGRFDIDIKGELNVKARIGTNS